KRGCFSSGFRASFRYQPFHVSEAFPRSPRAEKFGELAMMRNLCTAVVLTGLISTAPVRAGDDKKPSERSPTSKRNVAIVIYNQMELLDFAGPAEVFAAADGGRAYKVYTVAETDRPIKSQGFVTITPQYTIDNCPRPDILVIPGGNAGSVTKSQKMVDWVKEVSGNAEHVLSVCTGAFVLGRAGLLDGLEATTHHGAIPTFRRTYPKV